MKKIFLTSLLLTMKSYAVDTITFQIDHLNFAGDSGTVNSREIVISSGTDAIGFKSAATELFEGEIEVKGKELSISAGNGMFIKSVSPVELKDIPETVVQSGKFYSEPTRLGLSAQQVSTSVSNIKLNVSNLDFKCDVGANCNARATTLLVDNNMLVKAPEFTCVKDNCVKDFTLALSSLDDGKNFVVKNLQTKAFVNMKDLRTVTLKRKGNDVNLDGKVHVLIGVLGFEVKATIVNLTEEVLEMKVNKVKVSDFLSVTDFTTFLAKKLLSSKSFYMNGDNIVIKLK